MLSQVAIAALGALCRGLGREHSRACLLDAVAAAVATAPVPAPMASTSTQPPLPDQQAFPGQPLPAQTRPAQTRPTQTLCAKALSAPPFSDFGESLEDHAAAPQGGLVLAVASLFSLLPLAGACNPNTALRPRVLTIATLFASSCSPVCASGCNFRC